MSLSNNNIDIDDIIRNEKVITFFQPIISVKKKSIAIMEALSRGLLDGEIVPWFFILSLAYRKNLIKELDKLCIKKALEYFKIVHSENEDLFLSLNVDIFSTDFSHLINSVTKKNLNPNKIVIECKGFLVKDVGIFNDTVKPFKDFGFLLALDDIGEKEPSLETISGINPDIMKIDKQLVRDIEKKVPQQETVRSLVDLSREIGSNVVAEGVETEEEIMQVLDLGADMLQGYYFAEPQKININILNDVQDKIEYIVGKLKM
ncbi:EAL domain-containing protein [candidate division WOR-3 bacterium]|nr:EAL domain-containing protein [candidate division WOR-3 bacterium]